MPDMALNDLYVIPYPMARMQFGCTLMSAV
jgi:hypothetical protein